MTDYAAISRNLGIPEGMVHLFYDHVLPFEGKGMLTLPAHDGHTTLSGITENVWFAWANARDDIPDFANPADAAADLVRIRHGRDGASMDMERFHEHTLQIFYQEFVADAGFDSAPDWAQIQAVDFGINAGASRARWALGKAVLQTDQIFDNITEERARLVAVVGENAPVVQAIDRIVASGNIPDIFNNDHPNPFEYATTEQSIRRDFANAFPYYQSAQASRDVAGEFARLEEMGPDVALVLNNSVTRFRNTYYNQLAEVGNNARFEGGWRRRASEVGQWSEATRISGMLEQPEAPTPSQSAPEQTPFQRALEMIENVNMTGFSLSPTLSQSGEFNPRAVQLCIGSEADAGIVNAEQHDAAFDTLYTQISALPAGSATSALAEGLIFAAYPEQGSGFSSNIIMSEGDFEQCEALPGHVTATLHTRDTPERS